MTKSTKFIDSITINSDGEIVRKRLKVNDNIITNADNNKNNNNNIITSTSNIFNEKEEDFQYFQKSMYNKEQQQLQQQLTPIEYTIQLKDINFEQSLLIQNQKNIIKQLEKKLDSYKTIFNNSLEPMFSINLNYIEDSKVIDLEKILFDFFEKNKNFNINDNNDNNSSNISFYYRNGFILNKNGKKELADMDSSISYNSSRIPTYLADRSGLVSPITDIDLGIYPEGDIRNSLLCFNCSKYGHSFYDCPITRNRVTILQNKRDFNRPLEERYFENIERQLKNEKIRNAAKQQPQQQHVHQQNQIQQRKQRQLLQLQQKQKQYQQKKDKKEPYSFKFKNLKYNSYYNSYKNNNNNSSNNNNNTNNNNNNNNSGINIYKENEDYIEFPKNLFDRFESVEEEEILPSIYDPDFFTKPIKTKYPDYTDLIYVSSSQKRNSNNYNNGFKNTNNNNIVNKKNDKNYSFKNITSSSSNSNKNCRIRDREYYSYSTDCYKISDGYKHNCNNYRSCHNSRSKSY
ncbi:hypothetical protein ACTFIU_011296 [Dictyostelium citrinum]